MKKKKKEENSIHPLILYGSRLGQWQPPTRHTAITSVVLFLLLFTAASFAFSTLSPTQFFPHPKLFALFFSPPPSKVKIPTQTYTVSLTSAALLPSKLSFKSSIANFPLQSPLNLGPRRPLDPSNGAAIRKSAIVWFRNDLRVHDNECLNSANNKSVSVLPDYCFDPRDYGKSSSGFDKTGPYRATFLIESVSNLRKNLQSVSNGAADDARGEIGKVGGNCGEKIKEEGAEEDAN